MEFFIILFLIGIAKVSKPIFIQILDLLKGWKLIRDLIGKPEKAEKSDNQSLPSQMNITIPPLPAGANEVSVSINIVYKITSSKPKELS